MSGLTPNGTDAGRVASLLLVEDNPADVKIMQRALAHAEGRVELVVLRDGQEAVDYLLRQGAYAPRGVASAKAGSYPRSEPGEGPTVQVLPAPPAWRRPDLIVLDLNLPLLTGIEVLKLIRSVPPLSLIPVVILSTSRRPEEVHEAYAAGANTYIEKPFDFDRFVTILRTLQQYWLEIAVLPPPMA